MRFKTRYAPSPAIVALVALLSTAACDRTPDAPQAPAAPTAPTPAPAATPSAGGLVIEGEGLRIFDEAGAARALPFGTPQATVLAAVSATTGTPTPELQTNSECGAGPTQFATFDTGLNLAFQNEEFAGWFLDQPGLTTADGIGVGTTRSALAEARTVEMQAGSTLGAEFSAGDVGGFLTSATPDATVESLYAGLTCFFR